MTRPRTTPQTDYIKWVPEPRMMKRMGEWHVRLYRWTGGILGGRMDGLDMLLLTTRGRKSGLERTVPLPYFRDGDRYLLCSDGLFAVATDQQIGKILGDRKLSLEDVCRRLIDVANAGGGPDNITVLALQVDVP